MAWTALTIPDGAVIGDMTVICFAGKNASNGANTYLLCCNKCGRTRVVASYDINRGRGIEHRTCSLMIAKVGEVRRFYNIWKGMRQRTSGRLTSKDHNYKAY